MHTGSLAARFGVLGCDCFEWGLVMVNAFIQERELFPPAIPFRSGFLQRGEHEIYYEQCGNIDGQSLLFLHGGPGAGIAPAHRRLFDPKRFHVVLFDQRGCGQSRPHASLDDNQTNALIGDIDALRAFLNIDKFVLFGGSWGSTLALAYAIAYPEYVAGLILRGIFLGTRAEVDWFLNDMGRFFPEAHDRFKGHLDAAERNDLLTNYFKRLIDPDPAIHQKAAEFWASYETSCSTLRAGNRHMGGAGALTMARIEAHYFVNDCFMPDNHLMDNVGRIAHLPATIVQGRHDVICPPITASRLAAKWGRKAKLEIIDAAGHSTFESGIAHALMAALEEI
jgi:proline iminopeptidase